MSPSPSLDMTPILALSSCKYDVAIIENKMHHISEYPKSIPERVHKVIVPGPINAEVIINPGPILNLNFFILIHIVFRRIKVKEPG